MSERNPQLPDALLAFARDHDWRPSALVQSFPASPFSWIVAGALVVQCGLMLVRTLPDQLQLRRVQGVSHWASMIVTIPTMLQVLLNALYGSNAASIGPVVAVQAILLVILSSAAFWVVSNLVPGRRAAKSQSVIHVLLISSAVAIAICSERSVSTAASCVIWTGSLALSLATVILDALHRGELERSAFVKLHPSEFVVAPPSKVNVVVEPDLASEISMRVVSEHTARHPDVQLLETDRSAFESLLRQELPTAVVDRPSFIDYVTEELIDIAFAEWNTIRAGVRFAVSNWNDMHPAK
ncbi:RGS domain-containing protein [Plasmodiophora brassicae]|uniref:Uncharacterized protein n=1 Tax=Plasmodiophora brassicae TaxID=37360 RepID=A0A0G4J7T7_PLABS|nr:hypothetical protein PBRA_009485 [Plasmodiophora brassicae]SPQ97020.1 unnamed protein product [Plasmodiophora brassicae]